MSELGINDNRINYLCEFKKRLPQGYNIDKSKKTGIYLKKEDQYLKLIDAEIYWVSDFEKSEQLVLDNLNDYLKEKQKAGRENKILEPPIEKINHLRDAITANMVGVIYHLHQEFRAKFIKLENLDEYKNDELKFIESHRKQSDQHISRRLEWALYNKFQSEGLVPPNIKETILLKDEYQQKQFGIIQFVKTGGTSSNCPNCDKEISKQPCAQCGFNIKEDKKGLEPLDNYDKVAAYNIAKSKDKK